MRRIIFTPIAVVCFSTALALWLEAQESNSAFGPTVSNKTSSPGKARRRRYALGWSQSLLAVKLQITGFDISRSGVSKIEARLSYVDDKSLLYLAEVLKVVVQDLFPARPPGNRIHDFIEKLETTRF